MFAIAAENGHVPDSDAQALSGDVLGGDFRQAWKRTSEELLIAFQRPGVMHALLVLPFAETPGHAALDMATMEVGIHTADLARATGHAIADEDPFAAVLDLARTHKVDAWGAAGILGPEQAAPTNGNAIERLIAYAGRRLE